jgi:hypothetical protein
MNTATQIQYNEIISQITTAGVSYNVIDVCETNGISIYLEINGMKCRFSDHSVTNTHRIFNEVHFDLPIKSFMGGKTVVSNVFSKQMDYNKMAIIYKQRLPKHSFPKGWAQL